MLRCVFAGREHVVRAAMVCVTSYTSKPSYVKVKIRNTEGFFSETPVLDRLLLIPS